MRRLFKKWKWLMSASFVIIVASLIPIPDNPPLGDVPLMDKWVHFVMYGGLVFAAWLDWWLQKNKSRTCLFALVICLYSALLGGLMEILQGMTGYRSSEWLDFYADVVGAVLATFISVVVLHLLRRGCRPS